MLCWQLDVLYQFLTGALLLAQQQQTCRNVTESHDAQRVIAYSQIVYNAHIASPTIAAGGKRWYFPHGVAATMATNAPGVTASYSLPSCCITCLRSVGVIVQANV